ncbi:energy-coupling factor ABC transporter ATP-binding protein [Caloramator sp. Dgby_cultured_2]|uniref:energy-coupling factor ABC transporter ATP-binding protein n=1 Tax=Caloramator sp. Dgby_cultured_2 TaxID=3029174 RepID=UPI00237EE8B0|nr:ATP-binding cassette domain-containing protein [Caloramator sp. Dgby_cultured_2]WDU83012.1 ATP-binding cassette domain-containing protein [Caloramator sp. Dgby_cultured_2]
MNIVVKDLYFYYKEGEDVLKGINLEFDYRSTAIIGQNGAGKTTFVKLLKGLLKPKKGDIFIKGLNTKETTVAKLASIIGLVFQNPNDQIFKNKVLDEVMFGPLNIGQDKNLAFENAKKALELVGLLQKADENPYDLTLSERKLISIASILAMDTDIIILDEPTIAQDFISREKIKNIIKKLKEEGKLVITITHDMDFVAETFERTIVFNQGQVLLDGPTKEVFSKEDILKTAHLEPPYITQLFKRLGFSETVLNLEEALNYKIL